MKLVNGDGVIADDVRVDEMVTAFKAHYAITDMGNHQYSLRWLRIKVAVIIE